MKELLQILFFTVAFVSCENSIHNTIKKDLDERFGEVEIVDIKPDKAYLADAKTMVKSIDAQVSEANEVIAGLISNFYNEKTNNGKLLIYYEIDSIRREMEKTMVKFEVKIGSISEDVYNVKFKATYHGDFKEYNEYYLISQNGKILHRPVRWESFMRELKYFEILDK